MTPTPSSHGPGRHATLAGLAAALPGARLHRPAGVATEVLLRDVTHDSRAAGPGVLFACRPGARGDGHDFAPAAVAAGSPALLVERPLDVAVPQLVVPRVADALGEAAAAVHGHPADRLLLLGVTGTNGKTTTAYLLERALQAAGHTTGLLGTVQTLVAGRPVEGLLTTPEATDLQRLLARMVRDGVTGAVMEVSSHALALGRMRGTRLDVAAFTNLSQDHLDFHHDLEDYFAAKASLFEPERTHRGVVNVDDPWGRRLLQHARVPLVTVSARGRDADVTAREIRTRPGGASFEAVVQGQPVVLETRLAGSFNVDNALLALAVAHAAGIDPAVAARGIAALPGVPGRMERVEAGQPFTVLVDYAHTPEALGHVLRAARDLASGSGPGAPGDARERAGRVIVVAGCGGDRDPGKRPLMGRVAAEGADIAFLTSDNPRSEDPEAILAAMVEGARGVPGARYLVEADRRRGIAAALGEAREGDVVVIAGKGHEDYQEVRGVRLPFDDRAVAASLLAGGEEQRP